MLQKGLGHLSALYLPYLLVTRYYLSYHKTIYHLQFQCLQKTAYHFLLLLIGFDTLTYQKDYDRSPILVGNHKAPPPNSDWAWGAPPPWPPPPLFYHGPLRPINSPGVPVTSRYSGKMPEPLGTISMSKCNLTIYESLPLDHFETPRHVPDLI